MQDFEAKINNPDFSLDDNSPDGKDLVSWEFSDIDNLKEFTIELLWGRVYFEVKPNKDSVRVNLLKEQWEDEIRII